MFTRIEFQIAEANFSWPCANSRMWIQHKVEEAILISMMNENHLVVSFHCLAFNPRRLILQAKVGGKLFFDHLNRKFFRSSSLHQILAGITMHEHLDKEEPFFFSKDPRLPTVWSSTSRTTVKKMVLGSSQLSLYRPDLLNNLVESPHNHGTNSQSTIVFWVGQSPGTEVSRPEEAS